VIFTIGLKAGRKAPEKIREKMEKIERFLEKKGKKLINFLIYIYISFAPLPNELITIPLGLIGYGKKRIIFFLLLGNITSGVLIALLSSYGLNFFINFSN